MAGKIQIGGAKKTTGSTAKKKTTPARTAKRVEDQEDNSATPEMNDDGAKYKRVSEDVVLGPNGRPMVKIVSQVAEKVPVAQYANVVVGPCSIERWIEDPGLSELAGIQKGENDETLYDALTPAQKKIYDNVADNVMIGNDIIESVIAEDRENVLESVRKTNEAEAENGKK